MTATDPAVTETSPDGAFPIDWAPGEDELEWEWDDMHSPRAVPSLSEDYLEVLSGGFAAMYEAAGLPYRIVSRVWHGYAYFARAIDAPESEHATIAAGAPERWRAMIPWTAAYWRDAREELRAMYAEIDAITGDEPADDLARLWDRAWAHAARAWQIHFVAISGPYQVLEDLSERYAELVPDAGPGEGLELVAGTIDELRATDRDLEALTEAARRAPAVAARLRELPPPGVDEIRGVAGGSAFLAELDAFLDRHGHLGSLCEDLTEPSWRQDPRPLLGDLGRRLDVAPGAAERRAADRAAVAERRAETIRTLLADRPDELAAFEALLASAREIGPLTEGHNYWIDRMCSDRLRRMTRRVARRLVEAGVIAEGEDIVHLRRDEIAELIRHPVDRRALVAERAARHARNQAITPPPKVGRIAPPDPNAKVDPFDGARFAVDENGNLRGTGASAGIVRGVARVVLGPDDFHRVGPGEIVVATASNPGWVPLFAIAGGFVTDTGGILSHAAVVAREFGVPAVVGTREGTKRIVDGRTIEIDGTTGLVRVSAA